MSLEVISPLITYLIGILALTASVVPAFWFMNRFVREEPSDWKETSGVGIMIFSASIFSGMVVVNGVVGTASSPISPESIIAFFVVLCTVLAGMILIGLILAYPLHYFLKWQEPPEIVKEFQP